jgi:hypothetical protein
VHAGGGLLGDALDALGDLVPVARVALEGAEHAEHGGSSRCRRRWPGGRAGLLVLDALVTSRVASPPSSRIMFGPPPSGQFSTCSVHHQYSSRVSPFQA